MTDTDFDNHCNLSYLPEKQIKVVYYDGDLTPDNLAQLFTLQAENIDNLIYLPKSSILKTFTVHQLCEVRDQFVDYVDYLIGEKGR